VIALVFTGRTSMFFIGLACSTLKAELYDVEVLLVEMNAARQADYTIHS
jgi:hypothetical protein